MKKIISFVMIFAIIICLTGCGANNFSSHEIKNKVAKTVEDVTEATKEGYNSTADFLEKQTENAKRSISELSLPDFQKGFETAASFFGSTVATLGGQDYVNSVARAIFDLESNIANRVNNAGIASNAGNLAEEWHAGTYNIDAIARDVKTRASTLKSNELGSPDIVLSDETKASLKYYYDANESAQQQAMSYFERYNKYNNNNENALSMDEWLLKNNIDISADSPEMYWSIYKDQVRIIPKEQFESAKKCLEKSIKSNSAKDGANRQYVSDAELETLNKLNDRLKSADGAESIPLSKEEAEAIAEAAKKGDFSAAEFNINLDNSIKSSYIAKQAMKSGVTSAIIEISVVLGPEIYEIIKYGIENGELDEEQLKKAGIDGLTAGGMGFLHGSISNALVVMFKAGKFGTEHTNPPADLIGALTGIVIDAIHYGIKTASGKMTTAEYVDVLAQEVVVSAGSLGASALAGLLFPGAKVAIMIGSFIGGLVVSAGYTAGKTYALALIDTYDVDMLVPVESTADAIKDVMESTSVMIKDKLSELTNLGTAFADDFVIKVYNLTEDL